MGCRDAHHLAVDRQVRELVMPVLIYDMGLNHDTAVKRFRQNRNIEPLE